MLCDILTGGGKCARELRVYPGDLALVFINFSPSIHTHLSQVWERTTGMGSILIIAPNTRGPDSPPRNCNNEDLLFLWKIKEIPD